MPLVYFDASAFVKLVVDEVGSDLAADLRDGCDAALSSRLSYPEVRAALAAAHRNLDLTGAALAEAESLWGAYWAATRPIELTRIVARRAGDLAREHAFRGADAVHLASALAVGDPELLVAAWDQRLHAAARAVRLPVAPLDLGG